MTIPARRISTVSAIYVDEHRGTITISSSREYGHLAFVHVTFHGEPAIAAIAAYHLSMLGAPGNPATANAVALEILQSADAQGEV